MSTDQIREIVESSPAGKWIALLGVLHKLGGWCVAALAALGGIAVMLQMFVRVNDAYIADLKDQRERLVQVMIRSSDATASVAASNERLARSLDDLRADLKAR